MESCVVLLWRRVETEDGLVGWGECISQFPESALAAKIIIERGYAPMLCGEDPRDVERLWSAMLARGLVVRTAGHRSLRGQRGGRCPLGPQRKSIGHPGVQTLWAVEGLRQRHGLDHLDMDDLNWTVKEFAWFRDEGYRIVKGGWGKRPEAVFGLDRARGQLTGQANSRSDWRTM